MAAVRRDVCHFRPRQCCRPRRGATGHGTRTARLSRPQRAGHGARRDRLRQGEPAAPDDGLHHFDRAGRDQHGDSCRARPCEPPAGPAAAWRDLRGSRARSSAAADRGFRRPDRERERLLPTRFTLLGPHNAPRPAALVAAASAVAAHRFRRLRPGDAGAAAGRAGRGLRLPRRVLRTAMARERASRAGSRAAAARDGAYRRGEAAADRRRRRRALLRGLRGARRVCDRACHSRM
mgnify:CR=1 FL=1